MRTYRRLLTLGAICAGALGLTAVPASALTISVGGSNPTVPLPLPAPVAVSIGADGGGLQAGVQAPSTDVSVNAGPVVVHGKATVAEHPVAGVDLATPGDVPVPPSSPVAGSVPVVDLPAANAPTGGGATSSAPAVGADTPIASGTPKAHLATSPPGVVAGATPLAERDLRDATQAGDRTPVVTAEIASSPSSGFLHALPTVGGRVLLWAALAAAVLALRVFVGSATKKETPAG